MKSSKKVDIISCPKCGAEYLANEIYIPKNFFGNVKTVDRDPESHKILAYYGDLINTKEHYICDFCNTPFNINANIVFNTDIDEQHDFNQSYCSILEKSSLFLDEE